jgi:hypothetical protein
MERSEIRDVGPAPPPGSDRAISNAINVLSDIGIRWQDSRQSSIADPMNPDFADAPSRLRSLTGRTEASLSRTLKRFAELGIVAFQDGPHRTRIPALIARRVHLDIDLTGERSAVTVDRPR